MRLLTPVVLAVLLVASPALAGDGRACERPAPQVLYSCDSLPPPAARAAAGRASWWDLALTPLRRFAQEPHHVTLLGEASLVVWSAVDPAGLDVETRIVAQNAAFRLAAAHPADRIGRRALGVVERLALPAAELERLGSQPLALEPWLGPREGWVERATDQCGQGPLVHEQVFGGAFAFHPLRSGDRRALVSQLVAFDQDGRAHVTPVIEAVELRLGFEDHAPVCVLELDPASAGLFAAEFGELEARPPFVVKLPGPESVVGCRSCHHDARAFHARDVPEPEAETLRRARRQNLVEHATQRLRALQGLRF